MIFKLLAVRLNSAFPLKKNLKPKLIYKFSNDFDFLDKNDKNLEQVESYTEITQIYDRMSYPPKLYAIDRDHAEQLKYFEPDETDKDYLDINVSAIVGQNGAGKSSLLEVFYLFIFCISESKDFINHKAGIESEFEGDEKSGIRDILENNRKFILNHTDIELYYLIGSTKYLVKRSKGDTKKYVLGDGKWDSEEWGKSDFFYTIAVNYSQYGLNAQWDYYWLRPLFHKNDGYKTPLVLNPFRDIGNIDINRENHLAQIRLLTNLSYEQFKSRVLIDDKSIDSVTFFVRPGKSGIINGVGENGDQSITLKELASAMAPTRKFLLVEFFEFLVELVSPSFLNRRYFNNLKIDLQAYLDDKDIDIGLRPYHRTQSAAITVNALRMQLIIYILVKAIKICNKYPAGLSKYTEEKTIKRDKYEVTLRTVSTIELAARLLKNQSHVTLKLRQAINILINDNVWADDWESFADDQAFGYFAYRAPVDFEGVRKAIQHSFSTADYENKHLSHFVPGAFFTPSLTMSSPSGKFSFEQMSSGEQQLIHSVHSVLYHMLNLDSIHLRQIRRGRKLPEQYSYVNVILDEIELYYHPQYQKQFVKFLLENIKKINLKSIDGINILFSTHSPFILSDIPGVNVLRLESGKPARFHQKQTFGANIHDMLSDSFFMGDSLIGQFAEEKINECISYINEISLLKDIDFKKLTDKSAKGVSPMYSVSEAKRRLKSLQVKQYFVSYQEARGYERQTQKIYHLIHLIGEPIIRHKLLEMYDSAMLNRILDRDNARRQVLEILKQNNLNLEDL
ncbi:AAA family ATPase [Mucilaginibacter pocheonensis]|uniref:ATP-binding protein involved in virulence n=1 Tax=Mucilaginibacter pocheonensis TaxID=398050 RepID=A0ABU1TEL5_9SPHI|nr:AAA family ATPase [Mucilaginibacter pocheonensis]MDR6943706.1 putative ATP-binding protein involved in virulence [Mucilaginibacter pocheonensis]